jgi:DedD protein
MGLFDSLKLRSRRADATPSLAEDQESVERVRTLARRRLIGAAILLMVGIIGFPLLFETQPRPIPVDIPITIPARDAVPPLYSPSVRGTRADPALQPPPMEAPPSEEVAVGPVASASAVPLLPPSPPSAAAPQAAGGSTRPADAASSLRSPLVREVKATPPPKPSEAKSAQLLGESKLAQTKAVEAKTPTSPPAKPVEAKAAEAKSVPAEPRQAPASDELRFVVQVGAYTEAASVRDARVKVEALGLKTYTQVVEASDGRRIRVRAGPFGSKAEALAAAVKIKATGLPTAVLQL